MAEAEKEKKVRMTTVIGAGLHKKLQELAKADGRLTMPYVERVLQAHVEALDARDKKAGRK